MSNGTVTHLMTPRLFHIALAVSAAAHLLLILYFSSEKVKRLVKPVKRIEVTYSHLNTKKVVKENVTSQAVEVVKEDQPSKQVELLPKTSSSHSKLIEKISDFSKTKDRLNYDQKLPAKMVSLDVNRKISVPVLKSEKITNPKYIGYNQLVHKKIYETAQRYVNHPDVEVMGDVYFKFILRSDGSIADLNVLFDRTNAPEELQEVGREIIITSGPFGPFPSGLNYPELPFNIVISFSVSSGS